MLSFSLSLFVFIHVNYFFWANKDAADRYVNCSEQIAHHKQSSRVLNNARNKLAINIDLSLKLVILTSTSYVMSDMNLSAIGALLEKLLER